jgi:hypothetical protein
MHDPCMQLQHGFRTGPQFFSLPSTARCPSIHHSNRHEHTHETHTLLRGTQL